MNTLKIKIDKLPIEFINMLEATEFEAELEVEHNDQDNRIDTDLEYHRKRLLHI